MIVSALAHIPSSIFHVFLGIQIHGQVLDDHNVETQATRLLDILTTFPMTLYNESKASLLLFAESLRVCVLLFLSRHFSHKII